MTTKVSENLIYKPFRKNMLTNGAMNFWQRGTSKAMVEYDAPILADKFMFYNQRGTGGATYSRSTDVPTFEECGVQFNYSASIDITSVLANPTGTSEALFMNTIEGYDFQLIANGDATLSFWVKSNATGPYTLGLRNDGTTHSWTTQYTIDVADKWEKKVITIPFGDKLGTWNLKNARGVNICWSVMSAPGYASTSNFEVWQAGNTPYSDTQTNLYAAIGNYFRMTGVQMEQGTEDTEFEIIPYVEELELCERYCEVGFVRYIMPAAGVGAYVGQMILYNTFKMIPPTVTLGTPWETVGVPTAQNITSRNNGFRIWCNASVASNCYYSNSFISSAEVF